MEQQKRILDVGCGRRKVPGAIGLDKYPAEGVDVAHDLEQFPYPFESDSFDEIHVRHVIEHIRPIEAMMAELHRIAKPGALVYISTPHYSNAQAFRDPTHVRYLSSYSFEYFEADHPARHYTGTARFRVRSVRVTLLRLWRVLGVEWLVNAVNRRRSFRGFRKTWEEYLSFLVRAREIHAVLEVVKK